MGESVVIHYEQFSTRYTSSGYICQLYELTKYGHKDLSAKIFGNMGGENLILSRNKVYFFTVIPYGSSGAVKHALTYSYNHIWTQKLDKDISDIFLKIIYDRLLELDVNKNWKKNPNNRDSNDFVLPRARFLEYSSLIDEAVYCVSKPSHMPEDEFMEYLEPYGGKENFDPRVFLYNKELLDSHMETIYAYRGKEVNTRQSEFVTHLLTSRSYRLPSPVYINNSEIPGLLHCVHNNIVGNADLQVPLPPASDPVLGSFSYGKIRATFRRMMQNILDPEFFIRTCLRAPQSNMFFPRERPLSKVLNECLKEGLERTPASHRLYEITKNMLEDAPYTNYLCKRSFPLHMKTMFQSRDSLQGIEKALFESAVRSANILRTVYNSTSYLSRDLMRTLELTLVPSLRWKGARKQQERLLCSYVYLLQCILKTPPLLKSILKRNRYLSDYNLSNDSLIGHYLEELTGKPSILSVSSSDVELSLSKTNNLLDIQKDESELLNKKVRLYINYPTKSLYYNMLEESVACLEGMVSNSGVESSLEHGIQVVGNGCLFKNEGLSIQNSCLANKYVFPDGVTPNTNTYLGDVYFILNLNKKEYGININTHIDRVVAVIESILEVKGSVALKVCESYYLNGPMLRYLDPSLWLNLHC